MSDDPREFWLVDSDTGETILLVEDREARRCPVHGSLLNDDGACEECGLNWTVFS